MSKNSIADDVHATHLRRMQQVRDDLKITVPKLYSAYESNGSYSSGTESGQSQHIADKLQTNLVTHYCTYFRLHAWRRYVNFRGPITQGQAPENFYIDEHVPVVGEIETAIYNAVISGLDLKLPSPLSSTRPIIRLNEVRIGSAMLTTQMILPMISTSLAHVSGNVESEFDQVVSCVIPVFDNSSSRMGKDARHRPDTDNTCIKGVYTIDVVDKLNIERRQTGTPRTITLNQVNLSFSRLIFKLVHSGGITLSTVSRYSLQIMERSYATFKGYYMPAYLTDSTLKFTANHNLRQKSVAKLDVYGSIGFTGDPTLVGACFTNMYECIATVMKDETTFRSFLASLRVIEELRSDELISNSFQWP